jgi:hypothetical protein
MALNDSLAAGVAAMQGKGIDPNQLYGLPPSTPGAGGLTAPGPAMAGGAPSSPFMPSGVPLPAPGGPPAGPMPTAMPAHGAVPSPGGAFNAVTAGGGSTAPAAYGQNAFGVHPEVNLHQMVDYLLPKVRDVESSGNYTADRSKTHPGQTASGGYQYTDSTWNGYGGYKRAVDAPPEVQDQRAKQDFLTRLGQYGNDPFKAVAGHYFPKYAHDPSKWNEPLMDAHGKEIPGAEPVSKYVSRVLPADRVQKYMAAALGGGA